MCRSKVLVVLDMHLICATFLKVDFVQIISFVLRILTSNMEGSCKTLVQVVFIFTKIVDPRRLTMVVQV